MDQTRGERRAETARENDDRDIIEAAEDESLAGPTQQGRGGGNLQADLATQAEQERATDPNAHGQGEIPPHPATEVVTERD